MSFYRAVRAVAESGGDGPVDWAAVAESAKAGTDPGRLDLSDAEVEGYRDDVRAARDRVRSVGGIDFDLPDTVEIQHRHHWIDANVPTFRRILDLLDAEASVLPGVARTVNTGSMALSISFLANNVLGQYDPLLLAEGEAPRSLVPVEDIFFDIRVVVVVVIIAAAALACAVRAVPGRSVRHQS